MALVLNHSIPGYEPLPDWPTEKPDGSARNNLVIFTNVNLIYKIFYFKVIFLQDETYSRSQAVKGFGSDSFGGYASPIYDDKPFIANKRQEIHDLDRFYDSENSSDEDNIGVKTSGSIIIHLSKSYITFTFIYKHHNLILLPKVGLRYDSIGDETSESEEEEEEESSEEVDDENESSEKEEEEEESSEEETSEEETDEEDEEDEQELLVEKTQGKGKVREMPTLH